MAELIELRKLRRAREGIDITKLQKGDVKKKKKKKRAREEGELGGLQKGARDNDEEYVQCHTLSFSDANTSFCSEMEDLTAKTRRVIRSNNFTQQTNALDVDKHM